jgi:3-hydroxybutyryl-CoA dehydrogenase
VERNISRVAVVGTGQMGPGIAVALALAGSQTTLVGRSEESLSRGHQTFETALGFLVANDAATQGEAAAARQQLRTTTRLEDVSEVAMVIESIVEHLPTKQEFFRQLDEICPPDTILASNTSGLRISDIAALTHRPERTVTTHFWNPAHLMPLVEVIRGERTAPETVQATASFLRQCGKQPVVGNKDLPGQVCNRLFQAVIREAVYLVQEGIASVEDVEMAVKAGMGLRFPVYGPLEHLDAVGLDLGLAVQASVLPSLCNSTEPGRFLQERVAAGELGARTGRGFYDWSQRSVADLRRERDAFLVERLKVARRSAG